MFVLLRGLHIILKYIKGAIAAAAAAAAADGRTRWQLATTIKTEPAFDRPHFASTVSIT